LRVRQALGHSGVGIIIIIYQINIIRLEPPQGLLHGAADELRIIPKLAAAVGTDMVTELGG
jgi:hypothetical protein